MLSKLMEQFKKDRKIILASIIVGLSITIIAALLTANYAENIQTGIAKEVLRFHVLANSDDKYDQELKLKVRDGIIESLRPILNSSETISVDKTRELLTDNLSNIIATAEGIILDNGYNYSVNAEIRSDIFPTKYYGDVAFPAGNYEALRVTIGEGEGKNWWCVMFPPLCFVDITQKELPESAKQDLQNVLTEEEYNLVLQSETEREIPYKVKFKIVEIWQDIKNYFSN